MAPVIRYVLLTAASANRVYAAAATRLAAAELAVFAGAGLRAAVEEIAPLSLAGVDYLGFATPGRLDDRDIAYLSNLSAAHALYELEDDLLRPVAMQPLARFDDDLISIQKYAGKTNERFTQLLLNVTLLGSTHAGRLLDGQLTVLDPVCGRGTTLNQALMYGYSAIGIDTDGKDFDLYSAFIRTWLKRKRVKHHAELSPVRKEKRTLARRLAVSLPDGQALTVFHADTLDAREFLRAGVADVVVADLPYGVSHGSRTGAGRLSRSPVDLVAAAVPVWARLIQPGGAVGISFNTHTAPRADLAAIMEAARLKVRTGPGYDDLEHWVDQSITRDVLVARKY
jgi:hypothetical protein